MGHASTIFALATPLGRSAIAVIRISGPQSHAVLLALGGRVPPVRYASVMRLYDPISKEGLDEALVLAFTAPDSFTGEDCVEIQGHGGRATINAVLGALGHLDGLRVALPGEFARRAFLNGKMDLSRAEALADLVEAETGAQRRQALRIMAGGKTEVFEGWRQAIIGIAAELEAQLDFSDEADVGPLERQRLVGSVAALCLNIQSATAQSQRIEKLQTGFIVAIAGPPNAGKSTFLNALAGRDVAIVSPFAGTTRDAIEVRLDLGDLPVTLVDTAGIRASADVIEAMGISKSLSVVASADLVVWLEAPDAIAEPDAFIPSDAPLMRIMNKSDLEQRAHSDGTVWVSSQSGEGLSEVLDAIRSVAAGMMGDGSQGGEIRARHRRALAMIAENLTSLEGRLNTGMLEMAAEDARQALIALNAISASSSDEDVLDAVFGRFCIGK